MFPQDQIDDLKQVAPNLSIAEEGGYTYILLESFLLPPGCIPSTMDLLLCPQPKNGYQSILYFEKIPSGIPARNWNGNVHVLSRNWRSYSWQTTAGYTLLEMVQIHLNALRK